MGGVWAAESARSEEGSIRGAKAKKKQLCNSGALKSFSLLLQITQGTLLYIRASPPCYQHGPGPGGWEGSELQGPQEACLLETQASPEGLLFRIGSVLV